MPVIEDAEPEVRAARVDASSPAPELLPDAMSEPLVASVTLVVDPAQRGITANFAAVDALRVAHRWVFRQDRRANVTEADALWTLEEKLARAIFGERSDTVTVAFDGLDERGVPEVGAVLHRGDVVCVDPVTRERQRFTQDADATVLSVDVRAEGLGAALRERVEIVLSSTRTLSVGDAIVVDGRALGLLVDVVDDGSSAPCVTVPSRLAVTPGLVQVSIALPTARQRMSARETGTYDPITQRPTIGERVRRGALQSLVERGCLALVTDFAAFKFDDGAQRSSAREALSRGEPLEHPWRGEASGSAASTGDLFSLFDRPKAAVRSSAALSRAIDCARALAIELRVEGQSLSLRPLADATTSLEDAPEARSLLVRQLAQNLALPEEILVDFSGGATVIVDPALAPDALIVPVELVCVACASMLRAKCEASGLAHSASGAKERLASDAALRRTLSLWLLRTRPLLLHRDESDGPMVSANATDVGDQPVFRVGRALAERLFVFSGDRLSAHVPLSAAAIREADWLVSADETAVLREARDSAPSWVERLRALDEAERETALFAMVDRAAVDPCAGLDAAWLIGGYALDDDAGLVDRAPPACDLDPFFARAEAAGESATPPALEWSIDELELSVRTMSALQSMGVSTVRELAQKTEAELLKSKGFNGRSLLEVKEALAERGLWLGWR